jgi:hypothetical protein
MAMKVLFFSPYANIWDHSLIEYGLAESLGDVGHEVALISCAGDLMPQCIATMELRLEFNQTDSGSKAICLGCQKRSSLLQANFNGTKYIEFSDLISQDELVLIDRSLLTVTPANFINFTLENTLLGPVAFYEFSLKHKLRNLNLTANQFDEYKHQLRNVLKTQIAISNAIEEFSPDCVIVHNALYSTNRVVSLIAEQRGLKIFSIGGSQNFGQRQSSISLFSSPEAWISLSRSEAWEYYSKSADFEIDIDSSTIHFESIMEGANPFTYSLGAIKNNDDELRDFFGLKKYQKVCLATLSSEDEFFSANLIGVVPNLVFGETSFESQYDWLQFLITHFSKNPNLALIIRLHPREFPNKRDLQEAPSVANWKTLLQNLPKNVFVNWPEDNISVYQLAGITDLLLNWRSTIGIEFLALGIPVLVPSCSNVLSYPIEFNYVATNLQEYSDYIYSALEKGSSIENIRNAYLWISFLSNKAALPIKSTARISNSFGSIRPTSPGVRLRIWNFSTSVFLKYAPLWLERRMLKNWGISKHTVQVLSETLGLGFSSVSETNMNRDGNAAPSSLTIVSNDLIKESLLGRLSVMYEDPKSSKIWINLNGRPND